MTPATRIVLGEFILALAISTAVITGFNTASRYADRNRAAEMDARANRAALSLYDGRLIGSCGQDRCVIDCGDGRCSFAGKWP